MAKLALDWVECKGHTDKSQASESLPGLEKFDFTFLIKLKNVDEDVPLEREIIKQHDLDSEATEDQIRSILKHCKTLLIFDGYDEYKKGTNSAIDAAISGRRGKSFVLITSRPDNMDKKDKDKLDGKIQNRGLSEEQIEVYIERILDDKKKTKSLIEAAHRSDIEQLLRIPIVALMLCILYKEEKQLPRTQTKIIQQIIQIYIKRAKEKGVELPAENTILDVLGALSWEALQRKTHQLLIKKVIYCSKLLLRCLLFKLLLISVHFMEWNSPACFE